MMTEYDIHSDLAIPPGEYLLEVAEEMGINQADLARRMGRPPQAINEIVKGEKIITPETALQLEQVLGVPAHIWTGLEAEYQLVQARQDEAKLLQQEVSLLERFPYKEMVKLGLVHKVRDPQQKVRELWQFFGVASLHNLGGVKAYVPAFRQAVKLKAAPEALLAWLRGGELKARAIKTKPYDESSLRGSLDDIRSLSNEEPKEFLPKLESMLAESGVAFILQPRLPKTYVNGATFWLAADKAVLMMSIRGSWSDIFWFSLFHEIGHILLHDKRHIFLENLAEDPQWKKQESEANTFACDTLISPKDYAAFILTGEYTLAKIKAFAKQIRIHPGIIVGRLQHEDRLPQNQHRLRVRYKWAA